MVAIVIVGIIIGIIGGIWMLIEQFKTGILWGLGCLFLPFVSLIWLILHWEEGAKPFAITLAGAVLIVVGSMLAH